MKRMSCFPISHFAPEITEKEGNETKAARLGKGKATHLLGTHKLPPALPTKYNFMFSC